MPNDNLIPDLDSDLEIPTGLDDLLDEASAKKQVLGSWGFNSHIDFKKMSSEETNVWFFEQVFNFLRAYFGLVAPDRLEVVTSNGGKQIKKDNLNQMTFLDELMLIMKNLNEPIWVIRLHLNIIGFLRTEWDPDKPIRLMIQEPCSFAVWGGPDESGFQTFTISYSLFSNQSLKGEDQLLWSINQPLLGKAMGKWERQSGSRIEVVKGNSKDMSLYPHGFKEPTSANLKPEVSGQEEFIEPEDEGLPDLDDLEL